MHTYMYIPVYSLDPNTVYFFPSTSSCYRVFISVYRSRTEVTDDSVNTAAAATLRWRSLGTLGAIPGDPSRVVQGQASRKPLLSPLTTTCYY